MDRRDFDGAPVGIALIGVSGDDTGRIVRVNRTLAALLASTPEELAGISFCDLIHAEDRDRAAAEFAWLVGHAGGSCEGEGRLLARDGRVSSVHVHAGLLPTDGVPRAVVMIHVTQLVELVGGPETPR